MRIFAKEPFGLCRERLQLHRGSDQDLGYPVFVQIQQLGLGLARSCHGHRVYSIVQGEELPDLHCPEPAWPLLDYDQIRSQDIPVLSGSGAAFGFAFSLISGLLYLWPQGGLCWPFPKCVILRWVLALYSSQVAVVD